VGCSCGCQVSVVLTCVSSALLHFQRELLFSKLLAGKPAELDGPSASNEAVASIPHSPSGVEVEARSRSLESEPDALRTLSAAWSPQVLRTGSRASSSIAGSPSEQGDTRSDIWRRREAFVGLTQQEFDTLLSLSVCAPAESLDPNLRTLFGVSRDFLWRHVLGDILRAYGLQNARELSWRRDEHHFVILNTNDQDSSFFLHLEFWAEKNQLSVSSCSLLRPDEFIVTGKEARSLLDSRIRVQLQEFVNQLLHILFKKVLIARD
jgi:hypothetical protein